MKKTCLLFAALALFASMLLAAAKTYQVTGPIVALTNDTITVKKGNANWEIARDANTKITGDVKVGSKVKIEYRMTATTVDLQEEKKASPKKK